MEPITLEDKLLDGMAGWTQQEFSGLFKNLELSLTEKYKRSSASFDACGHVKHAWSVYGAIFYALKEKMRATHKQTKPQEDIFLRAYWSHVAAEGARAVLKKSSSAVQLTPSMIVPTSVSLTLHATDQEALHSALAQGVAFVCRTHSADAVPSSVDAYLGAVGVVAGDHCRQSALSRYFNQYKDTVVEGKNFCVRGIQLSPHPLDQSSVRVQEVASKGAKVLVLNEVRREDIVGNQDAICRIETEVPCLLHYDPAEKRNPFMGFSQYLLFAGTPGTGKTMLANYAMTLARKIAQQHKKPLSLVTLDFEDRYQCGPIDNLRNQLSEVTQSNKVYAVSIDELDTKIPSRTRAGNEGHKSDVIGEFLRFRGGSDYQNRGNYIIIATTNKPQDIDPAILDVFHLETVRGPVLLDEKVCVLRNNLARGIARGSVNVKEWDVIGQLLYQHDVSGREIVNIATRAEQKYRGVARSLGGSSFSMRASAVEQQVAALFRQDGAQYTTTDEDVIQSIMQQVRQRDTEQKDYLSQQPVGERLTRTDLMREECPCSTS